jgi:hypothetical protein
MAQHDISAMGLIGRPERFDLGGLAVVLRHDPDMNARQEAES